MYTIIPMLLGWMGWLDNTSNYLHMTKLKNRPKNHEIIQGKQEYFSRKEREKNTPAYLDNAVTLSMYFGWYFN